MTTYEDLTPYVYMTPDEETRPLVNVGWLGEESRFEHGEPPPGLPDALLELAAFHSTHVTRGFHRCGMCPPPLDGAKFDPLTVPFEAAERGEVVLGTAEIHVPGPGGIVYAAPNLVFHYVVRHGYRPPAEFVRAVLAEAEARRSAWEDAKRGLPVGTPVRGEVVDQFVSVLEISLEGFLGTRVEVPVELYRPDGVAVDPLDLPDEGVEVEAVVAEHAEQGRRIILRVGHA